MTKRIPLPCSAENCGDNYPVCGKTSTYDNRHCCRCDACCEAKREYNRRYREINRKKVSEYNSDYYRENIDTLKAWRRDYFEANQEAIRARDRQRYADNREARAVRAKQHRDANRESIAERRRQNYEQNREAFREKNRRYYAANREARVEFARRYRAQNPEKVAAAYRRFYAANLDLYLEGNRRRRARLAAAVTVPFTAEQLAQRFAYYGSRCYLRLDGCMGVGDQAEHVKPLSKGGAHMLCNLCPACGPCNSRKRDKWPFLPKN